MGDALVTLENTLQFNSREYEPVADQMDIRMKPATAVGKVVGARSAYMREKAKNARRTLGTMRLTSRDRFQKVKLE